MKNLLKDVKDAFAIAQAGITGTLKALKQTRSQTKTRKKKPRASKKIVVARGKTKSAATRKKKRPVKTPTDLVIKSRDVVPRKPTTQQPAKKSKSKYWP